MAITILGGWAESGCGLCVFIPYSIDSIPLLVAPPTGAGQLRQLMLDLGCLIKITELLNTIRDSVREVCTSASHISPHSLPPPSVPGETECVVLLSTEGSDCHYGG